MSDTVPGKITISRYSQTYKDDGITIRITDDVSRVEFVEAHMGLADFAAAVTGLGQVPAQLELRGLDLVGMRAENKEEFVPALPGGKDASLLPFLVDGWAARGGDYGNSHRGSQDHGYRVVFFRHVDPTTGKPR